MANEQNNSMVRRLARVLIEQPDPSACSRCLDALEAYCDAQLAGDDAETQFSDVAFHLDTCVACAELYAALYETLAAPAPLAEPPRYPIADLSFLGERNAQINMPRRFQDLQATLANALVRSGRTLRLILSQGLLELLPAPAPTLALRSAQATVLFELVVREPDALIEEIVVSASAQPAAQSCDLRVRITLRGMSWPDLDGIAVRLRSGDHEQQALSDAWGEVFFRTIDQASLSSLEISVDASTSGE